MALAADAIRIARTPASHASARRRRAITVPDIGTAPFLDYLTGVARTLCVPCPQLPDMLGRRQYETTPFGLPCAPLHRLGRRLLTGFSTLAYRVRGLLERSTAPKEMLPMYRNRNRRNELAPCRPFFHSPLRDDQRGRIFISPNVYKRAGSVVLSGAGRSILLKAARDYRIPPTLRALDVSERKPNRITIGPR
jgi:hypothetical protein